METILEDELLKKCVEVAIENGYTAEQAIDCTFSHPLNCKGCPMGMDVREMEK